jgi:MFS family permease
MRALASVRRRGGFVRWAGAAFVSLLGDQLTLVALPWLSLTLTASAKTVGMVFFLFAAPRALLVIVGGALADKWNPKRVLIGARGVSLLTLVAAAGSVWNDSLRIEHLYLVAALLGLCNAIAMPAAGSMLPRLLPRRLLAPGNAVLLALAQLAALGGPIAAGALLSTLNSGSREHLGFAAVFGLDALSFAVSLSIVGRIDIGPAKLPHGTDHGRPRRIFEYVADGWRHLRSKAPLQAWVGYITLVSAFTAGPLLVGLPILVGKFQGSAFQYGSFLATLNAGALVAMLVLAVMPRVPERRFARAVFGLHASMGALICLGAELTSAWALHLVLLAIGWTAGATQMLVSTRIQSWAQSAYLGRVMSYLAFAFVGLVPLSAWVTGQVISNTSAQTLFRFAGLAIFVIACCAAINGRLIGHRTGRSNDARPSDQFA